MAHPSGVPTPSCRGPEAALAETPMTRATPASPILLSTLLMIRGLMLPLGFGMAMISPVAWPRTTPLGTLPRARAVIKLAMRSTPSDVYLRTSQCSGREAMGPGALRLAGLRIILSM